MLVFGVYPTENFNFLDSAVVAILATVIVFAVLAIIIGVTTAIQKTNDKINYVTKVNAKQENKILDEDNDSVIATLVATIDYHREFNEDAKVISVERID